MGNCPGVNFDEVLSQLFGETVRTFVRSLQRSGHYKNATGMMEQQKALKTRLESSLVN